MNQALLRQAVNLSEHMIAAYYCQHDQDTLVDLMAPDITWIGPGEREKLYILDEILTYIELGKKQIPACEVSDFDFRAIDLGEDYCLVVGSMKIRTLPGSQLLLEAEQRVSLLYRYHEGHFKLIHLHNSNPYGELEEDEYFPHKIASQNYHYLQQLLNEKTEVLDMITGNINGGLKGSNDDSTFSYFYVNEGLPQMLGYTYDEFMEKTGGSAVGAVYPPDLPSALADCERCFAQGPVYSSEYRMEKKDGSLIWVLDSGRKITDCEGITRINSIIMDITPLKQALFDLEIERERYRIALDHITGAMCEYDVAKDLFTLYQKTDKGQARTIQQSKIEHFSQKICSGALSSCEDGITLLSLCTGKSTGTIEFRTHLLYQDGLWHWVQFSCSVIFDRAGTPVRAIGILKDITEAKERNSELLRQAQCDGLTGLFNHTTVIETIRTFLAAHPQSAPLNCALLMIDLDCFKDVNDLNGHAYGDQVLVETARILEETIGTDSVAGRIGGDEFLALVKNTESSDVTQIATKIIHRVRKIGTDNEFPVTCSIGVAYHLHREEEFTQFFDRVDKALYQAKHNGRNKFFIDHIS